MDREIPDGYMMDARGALIPVAKVKPQHKLEDALVLELHDAARAISDELAVFKARAFREVQTFREIVAEEYGASVGGRKGNVTLRSYDGRLEMQVAVGETLSFGPELQVAKTLIDECIMAWSEGANDNLRVLIDQAFQVNKAGRIDTHRVLALRNLEIDDEPWKRAMDAISDAVRVVGSKSYVRFYLRNPEDDSRVAIPLDIAAVDLPVEDAA
ncbi:MAG: DUF3164 family protein [Pseudomonadota bacterium]